MHGQHEADARMHFGTHEQQLPRHGPHVVWYAGPCYASQVRCRGQVSDAAISALRAGRTEIDVLGEKAVYDFVLSA